MLQAWLQEYVLQSHLWRLLGAPGGQMQMQTLKVEHGNVKDSCWWQYLTYVYTGLAMI